MKAEQLPERNAFGFFVSRISLRVWGLLKKQV